MTTTTIGLTGGIGSGKSTVAKLLRELGAVVVDADAIVHELQAPGMPMLRELAEAFGDHILSPDGALDRKALADIVFKDESARAKLGPLVQVPVVTEMLRRAQAAQEAGEKLVVLDIPLLFEGAKNGRGIASQIEFDLIITVWVPQDVQLARTVERDDCTHEEAKNRIEAQMHIDEKRELADHVIDNSGHPDDTRKQVEELVGRLLR